MPLTESKQEQMDQGYGGRIATYTGGSIAPLSPDPADIDIRDIAHALANQCRFTGHTRTFYSVAQHSVAVSELCSYRLALWGLLHDATEAYLADIARPIKRYAGEFGAAYTAVEDGLMAAIIERFGLENVLPMPDDVKEADNIMLANEIRTLCAESPLYDGWETYPDVPPMLLAPYMPSAAEELFLKRYELLTGGRV